MFIIMAVVVVVGIAFVVNEIAFKATHSTSSQCILRVFSWFIARRVIDIRPEPKMRF